jgi:hypothetical protein
MLLAHIVRRVSQLFQYVYAHPSSVGAQTIYEVTRVWLNDVPTYPQSIKQYQNVQVELKDGTIDFGTISNHPTNDCLSILTLPAPYAIPVVKVFGPAVLAGNIENMLEVYSATNVPIPFLYILDTLSTNIIDTNIYQHVTFEMLFVGLINDREAAENISQLNIVASDYIPLMLRNIYVKVNEMSEYTDLKIAAPKSFSGEFYVFKYSCEVEKYSRFSP